MTRHQMRQSVFMLTFERIFNDDSIETVLEVAKECETVEINDAVIKLFRGVEEKKDILDSEIQKHLKNWTIARISKVSLAVLRVAMYEILFADDIDTDIAISEAVKIAQEFTGKEDVSFVNGVLSSVAKALKGNAAVTGAKPSAGEPAIDTGDPATGEPAPEMGVSSEAPPAE